VNFNVFSSAVTSITLNDDSHQTSALC